VSRRIDVTLLQPSILECWTVLLQRCSKPPSKQVLLFLADEPHLWLNLADPRDNRKQNIAHKVVQARFVTSLWNVLIRRFGPSKQIRKLALDIYDRCLSLFTFGLDEGKIQDVCLELYFSLAEMESSIVSLVMEHEGLEEEVKREFWTSASVSARDEEILRALTMAPFG